MELEASVVRHKTAIRRYSLSRPANLLLQNSILKQNETIFDYGCGHGHDIDILTNMGFAITGYDPYYRPSAELISSDVVNLLYVLNVIENPVERTEVLTKAFNLAKKAICVSVMTPLQQRYEGDSFSDGVITKRNTFQKYYTQDELKEYLETTLRRSAIALEPGIFVVFREESDRLEFLENKLSRRRFVLTIPGLDRPEHLATPRVTILDKVRSYARLREILDFISRHGRPPISGENSAFDQLASELGTNSRIEQAILSQLDQAALSEVVSSRKADLEVIYATRRFDKLGYPKQTDIPLQTLADIKAFYGSYKAFLESANQLLFSLGSDDVVQKAFSKCKIGKNLPDAVYIHPSAIPSLPSHIRVLLGLADSIAGTIPECNLIKLNKIKRKISFMVYEDFDSVAHPALLYTYVIDVPKANIKLWDFRNRENPPILHRKETFVSPDYPLYEKFKKLTAQEEKAELLSLNTIGTKEGWETLLKQKGLTITGHSLKKLEAKSAELPAET